MLEKAEFPRVVQLKARAMTSRCRSSSGGSIGAEIVKIAKRERIKRLEVGC